MRVLIKQPDGPWEAADIRNTVEGLQEAVGGYFEQVAVNSIVCLLVDEDGIRKGLRENISVGYHRLFGPVVMVGVDGEEFCDLPEWVMKKARRKG